jgi:hypothetical protein
MVNKRKERKRGPTKNASQQPINQAVTALLDQLIQQILCQALGNVSAKPKKAKHAPKKKR